MGTQVFLFTDIEGSTRLWSEHPGDMGRALASHDKLMADAIAGAGGAVFKHTGDGVCAVFPSVPDATRAAAAAQRALAAANWGQVGVVRVRMAVHAGEAEPRDGDWFGPALNRAARLMGIGHGGQVLLSASAYGLASDGLGGGLEAVDLGTHRLRDLAHPEHAWQLVGDGLERSFPPLRSFDGFRGCLPSHLTSFIGRDDELNVVAQEVHTARLVTLVGPGGVGKSRLAAQLGAAVIDKFPDGAWMFELAPIGSGDRLPASMIATLGVSGTPGATLRDVLVETLRTWRALLILDNCEHLIDAVAELAEDLLASCTRVVVLATSREPLHVPGERIVTVGPLTAEADAVQLFVDRASTADRLFPAGDPAREVVARICRQLDSMPLAIELAAARAIAMTPVEIERRLGQRFRLLSARGGDRDERHGSLRRVVDWSYDLLDADHQTFFARLAVFAGDFDADAAHRVCWPDDEFATLDMLEDLVAKSMLTATPKGARTSYRLLETMRQYGLQHLPTADVDRLRSCHADFFAELAEKSWDGVRSGENQAWLELIDDSLDNLRAAYDHSFAAQDTDHVLQIAAGLFMYNHTRRLPEIFGWLEAALTLPGWDQHRLARHARLHQVYANTMAGRLEAEAGARAVLDAGPRDRDPLEPLALVLLSAALGLQGRQAEAEPLANSALERATELGPAYDYDRAEALWNLCSAAAFSGRPDVRRSLDYLEFAKQLGNARAVAGGLIQRGVSDPDPQRGMESLAEARELTARTRDGFRHGVATAWLGAIRSPLDPVGALRLIPDVVDYARATGLRLLVIGTMRDYLGAFASLARFDVVAVLDGASLPIAIRPVAATAAIADARRALGDHRYDELQAIGKSMSAGELDDFLMTAVTNPRF